jgi:hypothetical protein
MSCWRGTPGSWGYGSEEERERERARKVKEVSDVDSQKGSDATVNKRWAESGYLTMRGIAENDDSSTC